MKSRGFFCCLILICLCLISGCELFMPPNGMAFEKGEFSIAGVIPVNKTEAEFCCIFFGNPSELINTVPDIQLETEKNGFINLREIDLEYLSKNSIIAHNFQRESDIYKFGKTWPEDVSFYVLKPYRIMHSKSKGLVGISGHVSNNLRLKTKNEEYTFPLTYKDLKDIFGEADKYYKTYHHFSL